MTALDDRILQSFPPLRRQTIWAPMLWLLRWRR